MVSQDRPERPSGPERTKGSRFMNASSPYHRAQSTSNIWTTPHAPGPPRASYMLGDQQHEPLEDRHLPTYMDLTSYAGPHLDVSLVGPHGNGRIEIPEPLSAFHPEVFSFESPIVHQANEFENAYPFQPSLPAPDYSWPASDNFTSSSSNITESVDTPTSEILYGFDGVSWTTPNTNASDTSERISFSQGSPTWGSPLDHKDELRDQEMPGGYFNYIEENYPQSSPPLDSPRQLYSPILDTGQMQSALRWDDSGNFWDPGYHLSEQGAFNQQFQFEDISPTSDLRHQPWNAGNVDYSTFSMNAHPGNMAFAPRGGSPYEAYVKREKMFSLSSPASQLTGSEGSPLDENRNNELWHNLSPRELTPSTSDGGSVQENISSHWHIFSAENGNEIPSQQNPPRKLTAEQKRRILEVRKHGACWACHLSKIRCSPCSPGSPCEKCASLMGKRRFCKLSCFNDTIETLYPFLMPDPLVAHLTEANVVAFVKKHASRWGVRSIHIRMSWGSKRLLTASVVQLFPKDEMSEVGLLHQAIANGTNSPTLVRQRSPPLGIPLPLMVELQEKYRKHVQDIVRMDLADYPSVAYDEPASKLSESLLRAVCVWYQSGVAAGEKCALVEEALEVHIIETILDRSLILDATSLQNVQTLLGEEFPRRSAPRFVQRQIKLALATLQKPRTVRVMEQWGKMMYNMANSNEKWATAYSVFVILTLVMDQLITEAYYMCEDNIKHYEADAEGERRKFHELVRLMETELFERCKEIFHSRYKTRKGSNERFNPVRDGLAAWRKWKPDVRTARLVSDMQAIASDFGQEILPPALRNSHHARDKPYTNLGRLSSIFLGEFLH